MIKAALVSLSLMFSMMSMAVVAAGHPPAQPPAEPWKTVASAGRVEVSAAGSVEPSWLPLRRGTSAEPLSVVRTFARSRATLTRQGDLILVAAGSEVVLPERMADGATVVLQKSGHAIYKVAPRTGGGRFEVQTPFLVAGVKGTRFSVILENDRAAVSVLEGIVEVRSSATGQTMDLTAGMVAVVEGKLGRMEMYDDAGRERPVRGGREDKERRRKDASIEKVEQTVDTTADVMLAETLQTSEKLSTSLVEADDSLLLGGDTEDDLWGDLLDDGTAIVRTTTQVLDRTTTQLDPAQADPKTDPGLITKLLDYLRR